MNALRRKKKRFYNIRNEASTNEQKVRTLILPYNQNFLECIPALKKLNVKVVFNYENTVKKALIKNSPPTDIGVVYKIPCRDCNQFYIGQSGKDLKTRIAQHKYSVKTAQPSSGLFQHKAVMDHHICWENSKILAKSKGFLERNVIESCLISNTYSRNMNLSYGHFKCDKILTDLIQKRFPPD